MPLTVSPFTVRISPTLKTVINALFTDVVGPGSLAILDKSKVSPRYNVLFWASTVITTGASAAGEVCASSKRHRAPAAIIRNGEDRMVIEPSFRSLKNFDRRRRRRSTLITRNRGRKPASAAEFF